MQEMRIIQQSKSFKNLDRTLAKLTKIKKSKLAGDVFEYLTKLYLEVSPEYKTKIKKVYLLNEIPTVLKKKLKLPNTDEGIDLVAETFDNQYWAIQCKYRSDKTETLKVKGDLATFNNLAFTVCKNFSHGIIAATVNRPPQKKQLLKVGYILLPAWLTLDKDNGELFEQIRQKAVGKIVKPKKLSPRPHQKSAISKTIAYFKSNERGKMIMPCGTGKSLTAFWIAEKMRPKSILVAVPSLALLQQTLKVWTREFLLNNIEPDWLCVCSDNTVKEEQDDFVSFSADLGIKVDTDPRVIRNFLKKKTKKLKIVFTTYQSGRATAIGSKGFTYDLGIMDEAHKTVGSGKKPMAHLLHQKNIKINKGLFMTATERLFRGDSDEYMSMDDPRDYGDLIYELSFKEAINSKPPIISDYKIITFGITNPEIESITQDNKYLEVKKELKDITARELATAIALRKAIKKLKIKNAISFHRSIKRAENFRKQQDLITKIYPTYGKLKTFHVRGDMPTSDRALEMLSFEEEQGLMTNARCLTEGVDLPAIDCVCFTDPKRSKVDIVQAAGRALRLSKGKKFGYILIPIFIPDGVDFDTAAEAQGFDDVSVTVRALATTDKRIVEYLRAISEGKKPHGGSPIEGVTSINQLYKVEAEEFNKAVQLKVWDKVAIGNYRSYEEARNYALQNKIKTQNEWRKFTKNKNFLLDIPKDPYKVYKNKGWVSYGEFLGTGRIADQFKKFRKFSDAKNYARSLNFNSSKEWYQFSKTKKFPKDIPVSVASHYRHKGWKSWSDFLDSNFVATTKRNYYNFKKARKIIRKFKFKNSKNFKRFQLSKDGIKSIPLIPSSTYKNNGWKGWWDFLGNDEKNPKKYLAFNNAKKRLKDLKVSSRSIYYEYYKKGILGNLPSDPFYYKKFPQWKNLPDFLSSNNLPKNVNYLSLKEHYSFAKKHNVKNMSDWKKICKSKPLNIYSKPERKFKNKGWISYSHFFGNKHVTNRDKIFPFVKANKLIKKFNIKSKSDYAIKYRKGILSGFPSSPDYYNNHKNWKGTGSFLGTNTIAPQNIKFKNFSEHKKFATKLKLRNSIEWENFCKSGKKPLDIYVAVKYKFKNQWKGWPDFLGEN